MRCLTCVVLSCVFALCHGAVLNRPDGDGLRRRLCDSAARKLRVCCGENAALTDLSPPFQRSRRSVSSTPASPPRPPTPATSTRATTPATSPVETSATRSPKATPRPTATPAPKPPTPASNVTSTTQTPALTTPSGNGKLPKISPSARACDEFRKFNERVVGTSLLRRKRRQYMQINVVGGERARNREFTYMVAIGYVRGNNSANTSEIQWGCGGSLVSERYVLTAAHCITDALRQRMRPEVLRMGVNHLSAGARQPGDFSVESVSLHPRHAPPLSYFDLALLRTDRPVLFTERVLPVCLAAPTTHVDANTTLLVAGWGAVDPGGFEPSADLKKALLRFVDLDECKKFFTTSTSLPRGLDADMICAAEPNRQADTCQGDSGGPLAVRGAQGDVLVGVTSFGGKPCAGLKPGVYARVLPELPWIESVVWK
ncbi:Serine protease Hayan [Gryllus bimaculatus]|nr:Serine protease Hayan [Gryllus bimaculatus]